MHYKTADTDIQLCIQYITNIPHLVLTGDETITSDIQKLKQNIWMEHFDANWDYKAHHAHSVEDHTQSIQQSTSTHTKQIHNIQQQNRNHSQTHCEWFYQTIHKHCHTRNKQDKQIHQQSDTTIQGHNITLTTTQVQEAIKQI